MEGEVVSLGRFRSRRGGRYRYNKYIRNEKTRKWGSSGKKEGGGGGGRVVPTIRGEEGYSLILKIDRAFVFDREAGDIEDVAEALYDSEGVVRVCDDGNDEVNDEVHVFRGRGKDAAGWEFIQWLVFFW